VRSIGRCAPKTVVCDTRDFGVVRRFIQSQVGHECDSSTAIYTKAGELHQMGDELQVA
jgi:hypothetical protein